MDDRQAEFGIGDAGAVPLSPDHDQPAVDLLPPVHPRGIFLADEAALGEADAVQFGGVAFQPEQVAKLRAAFADAEPQAMLAPAGSRARRQARASGGRALPRRRRIERPNAAFVATRGRPMDGERIVAVDRDRAAQAVDRQALDQVVGSFGFAVEQQIVAVVPDEKIEQALALRASAAQPRREAGRRRRW